MYKELNKVISFGSLNQVYEIVIKIMDSNGIYEHNLIRDNLHNQNYSRTPIHGGLKLLSHLNIIVKKDKMWIISGEIEKNKEYLKSLRAFQCFIKDRIMTSFKSEMIDIFSLDNVEFVEESKSFIFNIKYIPHKFNFLKKILVNIELLEPYIESKGLYLLSDDILKYLKKNNDKKTLSLEKLKKLLEQKEIRGFEAEEFVLEFEESRILTVGIQIKPLHVSEFDVSAGYDIASFSKKSSERYDRFIEVKSFVGKTQNFYWSKNEVDTAKRLKEKYYLYIINYNQMKESNADYIPIIIQNPFEKFFIQKKEDWSFEVESYHFIKNTDM